MRTMTENQKPREALQAISDIDDSTNHAVDASAALDRIGQIARQALALPPADHLPDAGKMIETAAPVVERDALDAARYRWLADCNNYPEAVTLISDGSLTADALGKAIDAAMRKGQL